MASENCNGCGALQGYFSNSFCTAWEEPLSRDACGALRCAACKRSGFRSADAEDAYDLTERLARHTDITSDPLNEEHI